MSYGKHERLVNTEWAGGFKAGEAVTHQQRDAHVLAVPAEKIPPGEVPIMYDDESGGFVTVPADDLEKRIN